MTKGESLQALNSSQKEELWASRIRQCRESGMRVQDWCAEQGLSHHTYYKWQERLYHKYRECESGFYEVTTTRYSGNVAVTMHIGMYNADVYDGADEHIIAAVVKALKTC